MGWALAPGGRVGLGLALGGWVGGVRAWPWPFFWPWALALALFLALGPGPLIFWPRALYLGPGPWALLWPYYSLLFPGVAGLLCFKDHRGVLAGP